MGTLATPAIFSDFKIQDLQLLNRRIVVCVNSKIQHTHNMIKQTNGGAETGAFLCEELRDIDRCLDSFQPCFSQEEYTKVSLGTFSVMQKKKKKKATAVLPRFVLKTCFFCNTKDILFNAQWSHDMFPYMFLKAADNHVEHVFKHGY